MIFQGAERSMLKNNGNSEGVGGGGGVINDPSGTEILRGWGYGYFLEPRIPATSNS